MRVRVILDSGSQRSYVSCRLKESLNLAVICSQKLIMKIVGAADGQI